MVKRLPPLSALRAFEAAGRHLSFTRAAEELHVTQAAVSHQIKALEAFLDRRLFHRQPRGLVLSEAGREYLPAVRRAFELLFEATVRIADRDRSDTLTVSVMPSFATRWLVPRLGRFLREHPEINVRIDPSEKLSNFRDDGVDIGIRYGRGSYPGLRCDRLMTEDVFPVCSPDLLRGNAPLRCLDDVRHHVLLHDDGYDDWRTVLLSAGLSDIDPGRGPVYTDSSMLIQAAVAGQGIAIGRGALVADELEAGRLVRPFEFSRPAAFAYYVVCPEGSADRPAVRVFREWMMREAGPS